MPDSAGASPRPTLLVFKEKAMFMDATEKKECLQYVRTFEVE